MKIHPGIVDGEQMFSVSGECVLHKDGVALGLKVLQAVAPLIVRENADGSLAPTREVARSVVVDLGLVAEITPAFADALAANLCFDAGWMGGRCVKLRLGHRGVALTVLREAFKRFRADEWVEIRGVTEPSRTNDPEARVSWSDVQIKLAGMASTQAGWNPAQRYIALRHAGCPDLPRARAAGAEPPRPSFKHPGNSNGDFERYMALAEASARSRGADMRDFPRPRHAESWAEKEQRDRDRTIRWLESVWAELVRLVPGVFHPSGLGGFTARMTGSDDPSLTFGVRPSCLEECDAAQLYRIGEGLKAWGTNVLFPRDLRPSTFEFNAAAVRRLTGRSTIRERSHAGASA